MLREERLRYIMDSLARQQRVSSKALADALGVSDDTIRRDLQELADQGRLDKVHGGAVPKPVTPMGFEERLDYAKPQKVALARKVISLLEPDQLIVMDDGTTNLAIAQELPPDFSATVYTNSLPVAMALVTHPKVELVMLGGRVRKTERAVLDQEAWRSLGAIRADVCILGVCSVHPQVGLTTHVREEIFLKQRMVEVSDRIIVPATEEKLDTAHHYVIGGPKSFHALVVDDSVALSHRKPYQDLGIEVL